jgi:hypothetical protein
MLKQRSFTIMRDLTAHLVYNARALENMLGTRVSSGLNVITTEVCRWLWTERRGNLSLIGQYKKLMKEQVKFRENRHASTQYDHI